MLIQRVLRRVGRAAIAGTMLLALSSATVAAHRITVTPNGNGDGFGPRPISRAWAQAHCNAMSPFHIAESSKGVVQFLPAEALPCNPVANPGGQTHPHSGD